MVKFGACTVAVDCHGVCLCHVGPWWVGIYYPAQDTGPVWHLSHHSLLSPGFPRYPYVSHPKGESEHLGQHIDCSTYDSNLGL